jgi:hypothetical protein
MANLATQPNLPSYGVIFQLTYSNRYELHGSVPRHICTHFKNLLQHLNMHLMHVVPLSCFLHTSKVFDKPASFGSSNMREVKHLSLHITGCLSNSCLTTRTLQQFTLADPYFMAWLVVPSSARDRCFPIDSTVLTVFLQLCALYHALLYIYCQPRQCYPLWMDPRELSRVFITAYPIAWPMFRFYDKFQTWKSVAFCWVPGHTGLQQWGCWCSCYEGYCPRNPAIRTSSWQLTLVHIFRAQFYLFGQDEWTAIKNNKLQLLKPSVGLGQSSSSFIRREEILLVHLHIGHTCLRHGHLIWCDLAPLCANCGPLLTIS